MESRCGRYIIAYNGEIYNYGELRAELETRGVEGWRGHSDTEVLLEGIARDGVAATLSRADGMFALASHWRATPLGKSHLLIACGTAFCSSDPSYARCGRGPASPRKKAPRLVPRSCSMVISQHP